MTRPRIGWPIYVLLALGLVLVAGGVAEIVVAQRAAKVADLVRPELTDEGLAQHRSDFETASATLESVDSEIIPGVADQLGVPEAVLRAGLALRYPAVARVLDEQEEIQPFAENALLNLERQQDRFHSADSLPAGWLPKWANGALFVLVGAVVIATAMGALRGLVSTRVTVAAALLAAAVVLAFSFGARVPFKTADAAEVLDSLSPTDDATARTELYLAHTRAGMEQFEQELLPDAADMLGVTAEDLDQQLTTEYPDFAAGLDAMPGVLDRYDERAEVRSEGAADLRFLKTLPLRELGWFGTAMGLLLAVAAGLAWRYRPDPGTDDAPSPV